MTSRSISLPALLLATGVALFLPTAAFAQDEALEPEGGAYVSLNIGVTSPTDETFEGVQAPATGSPGMPGAPAAVSVGYDDDVVYTGAVGYRFPIRFLGAFQPSVELEYGYSQADVSGGAFNGGNQTFLGDIDVNTYTLNYRSELRLSNDQKVVPFFGGGIGIADVDTNIGYFPNNGIATAPTFAVQGSDTGFVMHSNAGVSFELTDNIDLEARVRYQRVTGLDFERRFIAGGADAFNADVSGRYETVSGLAGIRFRF